MENPYKNGSHANTMFSCYATWAGAMSDSELQKNIDTLIKESKNYCRYGWKTMHNMKFQADCYQLILDSNKKELATH